VSAKAQSGLPDEHIALTGLRMPIPAVLDDVSLSPRERQVLELLLSAYTEKQVATELRISPCTVHVYVKDIYRKFSVASRAELLSLWVKAQSGIRQRRFTWKDAPETLDTKGNAAVLFRETTSDVTKLERLADSIQTGDQQPRFSCAGASMVVSDRGSLGLANLYSPTNENSVQRPIDRRRRPQTPVIYLPYKSIAGQVLTHVIAT